MNIKYRYLFVLALVTLCFIACNSVSGNKNAVTDQYVTKEIQDRIRNIKAYNRQNDTVVVDPEQVDKKINDLVLLSKDIENLKASVSMGNQYFNELAAAFHLTPSDFDKLNTGMHADDIASVLRQNEMTFFNHILLKADKDALQLHTAQ